MQPSTFLSRNRTPLLCAGLIPLALLAWGLIPSSGAKPEPATGGAAPQVPGIEVIGRTRCAPKRRALIAPVPLHPVEEVLVSPGDRVKKGQVLIKIDADEQQAVVRSKKAALENAEVAFKEAQRYLAAIEKHADAIPEQTKYSVRAAALKAEADVRLAKAMLEAEEAELEHYTVLSAIDGVVNRLDVYVGMVSRPGTTIWGEILDLSEIDVRCELSPEQADQVAIGQSAEVRSAKNKQLLGVAKVIFVGFSADKDSQLVPVVVRLPNPKWKVRCEIAVQVRFTTKERNP